VSASSYYLIVYQWRNDINEKKLENNDKEMTDNDNSFSININGRKSMKAAWPLPSKYQPQWRHAGGGSSASNINDVMSSAASARQ